MTGHQTKTARRVLPARVRHFYLRLAKSIARFVRIWQDTRQLKYAG